MFKDTGIFLKEGLNNAREVGAITSTSKYAARAMAPIIHESDDAKVIVELGSGTGSVTRDIIKRIRPIDFFISIECNEHLFDACKRKLAHNVNQKNIVLLCDSAQNLSDILSRYGIKSVDEIICTIPFRVLPKKDTVQILHQIKKTVKPGGLFVFIRYIAAPKNKDMLALLGDSFQVIDIQIVMRNIPPAAVITMHKK